MARPRRAASCFCSLHGTKKSDVTLNKAAEGTQRYKIVLNVCYANIILNNTKNIG